MRNISTKMFLLFTFLLWLSMGWSVLTDYSFTSTLGTYTTYEMGTIHGTDANDEQVFNAIPIGFTFNYNGTDYTEVSITCNGFIGMGSSVLTSNTPLSTGTSNNVIAAITRDLRSRTGGTLTTHLTGTAPNRVFTVQYKDYRRSATATANDTLNFQIQLLEGTNSIKFNYGYFMAVTSSLNQNMQVGLRGASNTEYFNRTTTTNWAATTTGTANNASCVLSNTVFPANGLTFTWSPPVQGTPPFPAQVVSPANGATNVPLNANLDWITGGGSPTGYKVYLGTDNPPTNIVNGELVTNTLYDPAQNFTYSTVYYWKIVPTNDYGDAVDCPVWSFTAMPNPTVTTFPYSMNWDSGTVPHVPPSWTVVNANNDAFTWVLAATGAYSTPNVVRCSNNTSSAIPMDDWLISPPLVLAADTFYRITFRYKAHNASFPEKMEVKFGNAPTPAAMTEQIFMNENIINTGYLLGEAFISSVPAGTYYVGFHGYSNPNMAFLYIDDVNITEVIPVFNPPQNLTATTGNGAVTLNWQAPASRALRGYNVFRNGVQVNTEIIMTTSYYDVTAIAGVEYTYYAKAVYVSPNGVSVPSNSVVITPMFNPPLNLMATAGNGVVNLSWQQPLSVTPAGYRVYRNGESLTPTPLTVLNYADTNAPVGFSMNYYVTAVYTNPIGESQPSNNVVSEPLNPPTQLTATANDPNIILHWVSPLFDRGSIARRNPTRDLLGFKVYRDTTLIETIVDPDIDTYTDANLIPATYSYTVTALYSAGESVPAGPAVATVVNAFLPPSNLVAVGGPSGIMLTWDPPVQILPHFVGYRLFRDGISVSHALLTTTSYNDTNIIFGVQYSYYVIAVYRNPNGNSAPSNTVTATGGEPMDPVYDLQHSVAQDNVSLTWTPPMGPIYQDWVHYDDGFFYAGIGTNGVVNFDIAIRFTQTELSGILDRYLTKVRFFPNEANCVYTIKVWTGGNSATNPGNLVVSVPVPNPTISQYNIVDLPAPIQIPSVGELWVGVNINTQTGYPAGVDDGPSIPYKSNLIYLDNAWTILTQVNQQLDYNWNLQAFVTNYTGRETVLMPNPEPIPEIIVPVSNPRSSYARFDKQVRTSNRKDMPATNHNRALVGYKVYRNGVSIAQINEITTTSYTDSGLENGTYEYYVTALYSAGESVPCDPITAVINVPQIPVILLDGFENYPDFDLTFGNWITLDVDNSPTYGINGVEFENAESPMAFMVFNPSATTPPMTDLSAHGGSKMLASFAAVNPPNNDWLISPRIRMGSSENQISFWAKSYTEQYGLERFRVGVSTNASYLPATFVWISGPTYVQAPTEWTRFTYTVPTAYAGQFARYGIKCESNDAFILLIDDIKIQGIGGVDNDDEVMPVLQTALLGNYPNPFNPETSIAFSVKADEHITLEVYNLKGQKVKTLLNEKVKAGQHKITWKGEDENGNSVSSGVYYYRMKSGRYTSTKKMILMK